MSWAKPFSDVPWI